jgi:hypothetical protein
MGYRIDEIQDFVHLMDPADQARYDQRARAREVVPPPKTDRRERDEQRQLANWLLLQRSKGRNIPFCWHALHKPSTATPGTLDFWVGTWTGGIWIEFKRDHSSKLSYDQQQFWDNCVGRGIECYLVYSALEAINIVNEKDRLL